MIKIILDILKSYIPSLVLGFFTSVGNSEPMRKCMWFVGHSMRSALLVVPFVCFVGWWYFRQAMPLYVCIDDFIWDNGIVEYFGISSQQEVDRLIYASIFVVIASGVGIFWRVSLKFKRRNAVLKDLTYSRSLSVVSQHDAVMTRMLQSAINLSPNIVLVIDRDFYIEHVNSGYFEFSRKCGLGLPHPVGQTFFSTMYFLPIKKEILKSFESGEKQSFYIQTFIAETNFECEIILKPVGNGGVSHLIVYIIICGTIHKVKKTNE
jgi:hypothetical protein